MTGIYQHNLDSKGRIFIPAKLREELGEILYITISADHCLNIYGEIAWDSFCGRVNSMSYLQQRKMRAIFANAAKCELDGQGRILIPQNLRDYAGLKKNVSVIGCNNHAECWDSDTWETVCLNETSPENILSVMEELAF